MNGKVTLKSLFFFTCIFLVACGPSQAERNQQASAEAASILLTQVSASPTPNPALKLIYETMVPEIKGQGVPQAAVYDPKGPWPHRMVVLFEDGRSYGDIALLPRDWLPASVDETEWVVVLSLEREIILGTEVYATRTGGSKPVNVPRIRYERGIQVRAAQSGELLASGTVSGSEPDPFPVQLSTSQYRIEGGHVDSLDLETWLFCEFNSQLCNVQTLAVEGYPTCMAFAPDGQIFATASTDRTIRLWRLSPAPPNQLLVLQTEADVISLAFSPDGGTLASGLADNTVKLWQVPEGTLLNTMTHDSVVLSVAFSPQGNSLASGSRDKTIRLWKISGEAAWPPFRDIGHMSSILTLAFSPNGDTLVSGSADGDVVLWQVKDGSVLRRMQGHTGEIYGVAFSPDGQTLASASLDQSVYLWGVSDGRLLRRVGSFVDAVRGVAFSPDGDTLATGSSDGAVRLWWVSDGTLQRTLGKHPGLRGVTFSPDGRMLASWGGDENHIRLWTVSLP